MNVLKQCLNFYINSSIHVALAVYALAYITLLYFNLPYNEAVLYFLFYGTITGYNFVKYFGLAKFHHRSLTKRLKVIQLFSLFCFVLMAYYALQLAAITLACIALLGLITFFYAIPFLPKRIFVDKHQNLRSVGGLKVYVIALVWALATVFLPLLEAKVIENLNVFSLLALLFERFLLVIALMLPFEIRDLKYDNLKLSTIPQRIGVKNTKAIGAVLAVLIAFLSFLNHSISNDRAIVTCVIMVIYIGLLANAKIDQSKYYSSFWVEGIPILWIVLLILRTTFN